MTTIDSPGDRASAAGANRGFTLLEIMLAVAVLVIGILGVLALFPVALKSGQATIENTNAIIIAQSVEQAVREGLAHRKGQDSSGKWTFFLFQHSGVKDPLPDDITKARPSLDNYILLPEDDADRRRKTTMTRRSAYQSGKVFVYPETDGHAWSDIVEDEQEDMEAGTIPNGGGDPTRADDDGDDYPLEVMTENGLEDTSTFEVRRTYWLDQDFFDHRPEGEDIEPFPKDDPIKDYSFAFAIRRAYNDASMGRQLPTQNEIIPANELFEVEVLVFRAFRAGTAGALSPILRTTFLVHK